MIHDINCQHSVVSIHPSCDFSIPMVFLSHQTPEKKRLRLPPNTNTTISGYITLAPGSSNSRHLSIVLELNPIDLGDGQYVGSCVNTFELK